MSKSQVNPLFAPQREKSGAQTFQKYSYQYHWALYRLIAEHRKKKEYAVFLELHEDVVLADSLSKSNVSFEFNQVKTNNRAFTLRSLLKLKNGSSVLGKLISSCEGKCYSSKIKEINLICTSGFGLSPKIEGVDFEKMNICEVCDEHVKDIEEKLKEEIRIEKLPTILNFIVPKLQEVSHQQTIIGEIASLISSLFPSARCDATAIYRLLIDELMRKGMNQFDYDDWHESLAKKALVSSTVTRTINEFTSYKNEESILIEFNRIADELGLKTIPKNNLYKSLIRYKNERIGTRSSLQLRKTQTLQSLIEECASSCGDSISLLIDTVCAKFPNTLSKSFSSKNDLIAAVICEYIMGI